MVDNPRFRDVFRACGHSICSACCGQMLLNEGTQANRYGILFIFLDNILLVQYDKIRTFFSIKHTRPNFRLYIVANNLNPVNFQNNTSQILHPSSVPALSHRLHALLPCGRCRRSTAPCRPPLSSEGLRWWALRRGAEKGDEEAYWGQEGAVWEGERSFTILFLSFHFTLNCKNLKAYYFCAICLFGKHLLIGSQNVI